MERIGFMARNIETGVIYNYTFKEDDSFYIDYGNNHWLEEDVNDFEILEMFYSYEDWE